MTPRQWLKHRIYGARGSFPYFGVTVHFPPRSSAFTAACRQGIFEADNVRILQGVCHRRGGHMLDVGANIGLIAIPVLTCVPDGTVVSFEPSPNSLPSLRRTVAGGGFGNRWRLVERALGATPHTASFSLSRPDDGLFDGLRSTGRVAEAGKVEVEVSTLDAEWRRLGSPPVSAIKIDVEGAELDVLRGARECLDTARPAILLEWNATNLSAYDVQPEQLLEAAQGIRYGLYALPAIVPVRTASELALHMIGTESFLLMPSSPDGTPAC